MSAPNGTPAEIAQAAQSILEGLPQRLDQVLRPWAQSAPHQPALIGHGRTWTYGDLARIVDDTATLLRDHGVRGGDRVMIVSENSLALAALVLASSAMDAWSVVVNPRLSEREIDQIRDHCGARVLYYTVGVSELARAHAARHAARDIDMGALGTLAVSPVNDAAIAEPGNEEVVAYVQLLPGAAAGVDALTTHAARQLTAYKRPAEIIVLDALPASATGKILKHKLAAAARHPLPGGPA
ncbi:MAG: AMP-binding protein [Reyranella sp.]|uniref:AMP-binding protein n=1 Tax=Reyranella sp. TaxID=1929291 RepID=UPI003D0D5205